MLTLVDLCAGTGAFSYAFEKTKKIKCIFANDICNESEQIFNLNHDIKLTKGDLNNLSLDIVPKHDILCAGFPCQSFSISGKQKGFSDPRTNIFWTIIKIIKLRKPKIIILENVKNLKSHDKGNTFKIIHDNLTKLGYHVKYNIINTCKVTEVPQNRERIYIICCKNKRFINRLDLNFKQIKNKPIKHYLQQNINNKYYYSDRFKVYDTIKQNVCEHIDNNVIYQYRRYYIRQNKNNVCPTLTANMGGGGHNVPLLLDNKGIRKLTPRECFNLQGFPNDYLLPNISDTKLYHLAGNAVSVPVIELIANRILSIIRI